MATEKDKQTGFGQTNFFYSYLFSIPLSLQLISFFFFFNLPSFSTRSLTMPTLTATVLLSLIHYSYNYSATSTCLSNDSSLLYWSSVFMLAYSPEFIILYLLIHLRYHPLIQVSLFEDFFHFVHFLFPYSFRTYSWISPFSHICTFPHF